MKNTSLLCKILIISVITCIILIPYRLIAEKSEFYLQVLAYGTDQDITSAFNGITDDLGPEVDKKVLVLFKEKHSIQVYTVLVGYIGATELAHALNVLQGELERTPADDNYREEVIRALGSVKNPASLTFLKQYYFNKKASKRIKKAIVTAWGDIGSTEISSTLIDILKDVREDGEIRAQAALSLGKIKSVAAYETLKEIAENRYEDKILRMYAVYSLGQTGGEQALETLGNLVDDDVHEVAEYAVKSIADMKTQQGGDYLISALRSDYDSVRFYAIQGLADLKYQKAVDILEFKVKYDKNERVRNEAKKALDAIAPSKSVPSAKDE